jgi:hypothetical protein
MLALRNAVTHTAFQTIDRREALALVDFRAASRPSLEVMTDA